jgi:small nuclear ribonucleoprotein (snRNP)-like protein
MAAKKKKRQVVVTTERRGVFYGTLESYDKTKRVAVLKDAAMAIRWGTTKGLFELCATGPTSSSKISARAPEIRLEVCECVIDCKPEAVEAWKRATS